MNQEEIKETVRVKIAEAIGVDDSEVRHDTNLMEELGAESIDFLDIVFKLEQTFDIEITRGALEQAARGDTSDDDFAPDGVISEAGLERLRQLMPEASARIVPGLRPVQILSLFSVETFLHIALAKLSEKD